MNLHLFGLFLDIGIQLWNKKMLKEKFSLNGYEYTFDRETGICRQLNPKTVNYDKDYIATYNSYAEWGARMAYLRLGFLLGTLPEIPNSVLDVGYGNGDFLKACANIIPNVFGYDISPAYPIEPIPVVDNLYFGQYDVVCFLDSLEHFIDPYIIKDVNAKYIFITVPHFHPKLGYQWFAKWRHTKPNEHLWYFSEQGLVNFFNSIGYNLIKLSPFEDTIRKNNEQVEPNILSGLFKKSITK
jgi:SAM-dependent methyltransferase